jgi:hypothetical protein
MPDYRFFQTNAAGQILDGHLADCADDEEAIAVAPEYLTSYAAVEIWHQRRRIARIASMAADKITASEPQSGRSA